MLYTDKLNNLKEMDKFLETYNLTRLNQEETDNLNRVINSSKIEFITNKTPSKQKPRISFTGDFYQTDKEELTPILLKLFQKMLRNTPKLIL